ncbi:MAG: ParA family protein [Tissierellaceae bacterium]
MKDKVFLCLGDLDPKYKKIISKSKINIVDYEDNIDAMEDVLEIVDMDFLIINRALDETIEGKTLIRLARIAREKKTRVILLIREMESPEEKKLVTKLIGEGVTSFILYSNINRKSIERDIGNYPEEFDFRLFGFGGSQKIKTVFKELIAVYSPLSQGSTTIATHLAMALAKTQNCKVCLVDLNPFKPSFKKIFKMDFQNTISNVFDSLNRDNLSNEKLESFLTTYKEQRNLDLLPGFYDINDYYTLASEDTFPKYIDMVIEKLKFLYDYVIIDTHSFYDLYTTNQVLLKSDRVLVPLYGNLYDIKEVNRHMDTFKKYGDFDTRKFSFVINRYSGEDLTFIEMEANLRGEIAGYISEDKAYSRGNAFINKRLMREYLPIIRHFGINGVIK